MRRFLVDNQLPAALARWIEDQGHCAEHVLSLDLGQSPDSSIWNRAMRTGAIIISKDEDFAQLTLVKSDPVVVIWIRFGNCRTATLLANIAKVWPAILGQIESGAKLIEVH